MNFFFMLSQANILLTSYDVFRTQTDSFITFLFLSYVLTLMIISNMIANCSSFLLTNSQFWDKVYPTITFIMGSGFTYILSLYSRKKEERKELDRYEYSLILDILEFIQISEKEKIRKEVMNLYNKEKRNPLFIKSKNYTLILNTLVTILENKEVDPTELKIIKVNLETRIKKDGLL